MVIGVMTRVFRMCPLTEALERIARLGFRTVAFLGQHEGRRTLRVDMTDADVQHIRQALARCQLQPLMAWNGVMDPANLQPAKIRIQRAAEIGIPVLLLIGPRSSLDRDTSPGNMGFVPQDWERFADALGQLQEYGRTFGVRLAIKPHGGPIGHAQGLARLLAMPGAQGVSVFYDPGNVLYYLGFSPEADLPFVAPHVKALCVKDHAGPIGANDFPVPGRGDVDWPEIRRILAEVAFDGPLLIEMLPGAGPAEVERALIETRRYLHEVFGEERM